MKQRIAALAVLVGLLSLLLVSPAAAAPPRRRTGCRWSRQPLVGLNNTLNQDQVGLVNIGKSLNNLAAQQV